MLGPISSADFKLFHDLLFRASGISLGEDKKYLVEGRLAALALRTKATSWNELYNLIRKQEAELIPSVVDLLTTHETSWFRDDLVWEVLAKKIVPDFFVRLKANDSKKIRIWSAASSTGQEAYSLAFLLREIADRSGLSGFYDRFSILGTDISKHVVESAQLGQFDQLTVQRGLSPQRIQKYFKEDKGIFKLQDEIKKIVSFRYFNLMDSFSDLPKFDLILCRNVLIYFSQDTKKSIFAKISRSMEADGVLLLGSTESTLGISEEFIVQNEGPISIFRQKTN